MTISPKIAQKILWREGRIRYGDVGVPPTLTEAATIQVRGQNHGEWSVPLHKKRGGTPLSPYQSKLAATMHRQLQRRAPVLLSKNAESPNENPPNHRIVKMIY